ncbi:MAG TPA: S41 family peptidase [Fimbriimonas sp.]|nr:S41 family peptidase [Fimbriimonas sp.]
MRTQNYISIGLALLMTQLSFAADMTADEKKEVIKALNSSMQTRYVLADQAKKLADLYNKNLSAGVYDGIKSGAEFAKRLSDDATSICQDAHLRIRYSEKPLPVRTIASEPSAAEVEQIRLQTVRTNAGFEEVKRLEGNVGYVKFNFFDSPEAAKRRLRSAMSFLANTDALIIDLRDNGGGYPETVNLFCSYFFDKPTHVNSILTRQGDKLEEERSITTPVADSTFTNKPIYVLVGKRTGSGAEECSYNLQTQKRGVIIGESTWGGANPGGMVRLTDNFSAFIPFGMAKNPITGKNWEGTGVIPDVKVPVADALKTGHKLVIEALAKGAKGKDQRRLQEILAMLSAQG